MVKLARRPSHPQAAKRTVTVHQKYNGTYVLKIDGQPMTYAEAVALADKLALPRAPDTAETWD